VAYRCDESRAQDHLLAAKRRLERHRSTPHARNSATGAVAE
jgi:hypothetical protein